MKTPDSKDDIKKTDTPLPDRNGSDTPFSDQIEDRTNDPSDLNQEDLEALGPIDLSMDGGADEQLKHRSHPVDFSGDDLDVPGSELDDENEATGSEDEENNSYSIGGDNHDKLEEDQEYGL